MFSHVGIILGGYHRACWWYQAPRLNTYSSKARSRHLESCPRLPGDPEERALFFDFETSKEVSEISANSWIYPKKKQKQLQDGHYLPKIPGKHWAGLKKKKNTSLQESSNIWAGCSEGKSQPFQAVSYDCLPYFFDRFCHVGLQRNSQIWIKTTCISKPKRPYLKGDTFFYKPPF